MMVDIALLKKSGKTILITGGDWVRFISQDIRKSLRMKMGTRCF